jgi:uncharacterized repeat protein (TIGR03803 family)
MPLAASKRTVAVVWWPVCGQPDGRSATMHYFTDLLRCVTALQASQGVAAMVRLGLRAALAALLALPAAAGASGLKTLYQFTQPFGSLGEFTVAKSGLMYGTSSEGGSAGLGTVFSFDPKTRALALLHSFQGGSDGSKPVAGMALHDGTLYGATAAGGPTNDGTVFSFDTKTGTEVVLHSFGGSDGQTPQYSPTLSADGILYGTTSAGGKAGGGVAYQIKPNSSATKILFNFGGAAGANPNALTIGSDGLLYGTSYQGGAYNFGTLFTLDTARNKETVLYSFPDGTGLLPSYNVILGQNGLIFGLGAGDLFIFNPNTGVVTGAGAYTGGGRPDGKLVMDQAGNLYGSAEFDGDFGKVFEYDPITQAVTTIWLSKRPFRNQCGMVAFGVGWPRET